MKINNTQLEERLRNYSLIAVGGVLVAGSPIYGQLSAITTVNEVLNFSNQTYSIDFDGGGINDISFRFIAWNGTQWWATNAAGGSMRGTREFTSTSWGFFYPKALGSNTSIGPANGDWDHP